MIIELSPQVADKYLEVVKKGEQLFVNGELFMLSPIPEGGVLPASAINSEFFVGPVTRKDGVLHLTLLTPISWDASEEECFPKPLVNPPDGLIFKTRTKDVY